MYQVLIFTLGFILIAIFKCLPSATKVHELGDVVNTYHNYIEELKNMVRSFKTSGYINYESVVCELDDIEEREADGGMNDTEKEVFSSDLRVARQWVQQSRKKK